MGRKEHPHFRQANAFPFFEGSRIRSNLYSVYYAPTDQPITMEECPPCGDCASGEGDPSKSDNPPASWTANPAGEQDQGQSERSQLRSYLLAVLLEES